MDTENSKSPSIPVEVDLVSKVKQCRTCEWFWGGVPPYGRFPSYDFSDEFPQAIKDGPTKPEPTQPLNAQPIKWTTALQTKTHDVEPAVLRGCRKAPIMTIGINPNMTAYFPGTGGATWSYPYFKREQTYAYYYRHASIYQESIDLEVVREWVIKDSEIFAEKDGTVSIQRSKSHRFMSFEFQFSDGTMVHKEKAWHANERLVVFVQSRGKNKPIPVKKNELVAALIRPPGGEELDIYANITGYYDRMTETLDRFQKYLQNEEDRPNCAFSIGEDVSLHDMVACASPGWQTSYDIPREVIANNCVNEHQYMLDQLIQSRPRIVIVVSSSSLKMLNECVVKAGGKIDLDFKNRDIYDLLDECKSRRCILSIGSGTNLLATRIITVPHFSYADNFEEQSRFSLEAWEIFEKQFPEAVEILEANDRCNYVKGELFRGVHVRAENDELQSVLPAPAWRILMDYHFKPYTLILDTLINEHQHDSMMTDNKAIHLDRPSGNCQYCKNERWTFPEGCEYGVAK